MLMQIIAVRDNRIEAFMQPTFVAHPGQGVRAFQDHCQDEKTDFHRHPEDFDLYLLGEYNDQTGQFSPPDGGPQRLIRAFDIVAKS